MAERQNTQQQGASPPGVSDELRAAIRDEVRAALADVAAEARAQVSTDDPADRVKRTIRHSLFSYRLPGGGEAVARRGETVELFPDDDERGKKFDAFTARVGDSPEPPVTSTLPEFPTEGSDAEQTAWVESGSVPEILRAVNAQPAILPAVTAAEQRRKGDARKTLLEALARAGGE